MDQTDLICQKQCLAINPSLRNFLVIPAQRGGNLHTPEHGKSDNSPPRIRPIPPPSNAETPLAHPAPLNHIAIPRTDKSRIRCSSCDFRCSLDMFTFRLRRNSPVYWLVLYSVRKKRSLPKRSENARSAPPLVPQDSTAGYLPLCNVQSVSSLTAQIIPDGGLSQFAEMSRARLHPVRQAVAPPTRAAAAECPVHPGHEQ